MFEAHPNDLVDTSAGARSRSSLSVALMIETLGMAGAENMVFQLGQELRERGHRVCVVIPDGREGWLLDQLRAHGFRWRTYDLRRVIDVGLPRRMARMLEEEGIDVVHSHEFTTSVYGAVATRIAGLPLMITWHGNEATTRRLRRRIALRWAFRRSRAVVAVSEGTRRDLVEKLGVRPETIRVVRNGIPRRPGDRTRARTEMGLGGHELLLLAVGTLIPRKGHAVLLRALATLAPEPGTPPWRLAIAGAGDERDRLEALATELGIRDRVAFLGLRGDIPDLQAAADVFVMPSLWEGLPLAILEAMFAGNAIVASRTAGIPEAIDHDRQGLLTTPGDADELARALGAVLRDEELRRRLGRSALKRAEEEFAMAAMADTYETLYRELVAAPKGSPL